MNKIKYNKKKSEIKTTLLSLIEITSLDLMHYYDDNDKKYNYKVITYNNNRFFIIDELYDELNYVLHK